jgi:hypothetical protein
MEVMAGKMRFIFDNYVDSSTLTATPDLVGTLPASNLALPFRSKVTRSTSTSAQQITCTFATTGLTVSGVILGRVNFSTDVTYRIKMYGGAGILHDSGDLTTADIANFGTTGTETATNIAYWIDANNTVDQAPVENINYITIDISGASGITYYEIGRLIIGEYIEPTYNLSYGHGLSWEEDTKQYRTISGTLRSDVALPYRQLSFDIGTIKESDRQLLQDGMKLVGLRKDFFVSIFPWDDTQKKLEDYAFIGKFIRIPQFSEIQHNYYKTKCIIEEA